MIRGYAAQSAGAPLEPYEYDPGPLGPDEVEIAVESCGVCHSDLSMIKDEWGMASFPFVPGHEVVGTLRAAGEHVRHLSEGARVGLGWFSASCATCPTCMGGDHNLCPEREQTIVGRHGGFAEAVRCKAEWAIALPEELDARTAGPLFCGGITVFNPLVQLDVRPTERVGVIGIGGLGHLALKFLSKWGCEVVAFTSSPAKREEALAMGAHRVVASRERGELERLAGSLDVILSTVNADLDWELFLEALGPRGRLHTVGAAPSPIPVQAFALIPGQKSVSGSPLGSPATLRSMLAFCARHGIAPQTEHFPMERVNDALEHLDRGEARYRIVLDNGAH
jgi:uncharacterized zinc-type alcohol dehydrogenase-like protein